MSNPETVYTPRMILDQPGMKDKVAKQVMLAQKVFSVIDRRNVFYLNEPLLLEAVEACYCDMFRLKTFRGISNEDRHKQAAFFIMWIAKLRPVQLLPGSSGSITKGVLEVNEWFALYVGLTLLDVDPGLLVSNPQFSTYIRNLAYLLHWHHFNTPECLASELFLLETLVAQDRTVSPPTTRS